jgi:hypothetical protein
LKKKKKVEEKKEEGGGGKEIGRKEGRKGELGKEIKA